MVVDCVFMRAQNTVVHGNCKIQAFPDPHTKSESIIVRSIYTH